jgi:hypothetical protein
MNNLKVISGGQTGVDRIALEVSYRLNIDTGGYVPKGFLTETGRDYSLKKYSVIESGSSKYPVRTELNVKHSDGTIYYSKDLNSKGYKLTKKFCDKLGKPFILNPSVDEFNMFVEINDIKVLNIAGNRKSKLTDKNMNALNRLLEKSLLSCI